MTSRPYFKHCHTPPPAASTRARCPVCREAVYSRGGIHPQCAVRQCDPPKSKGKRGEVPAVIDVNVEPPTD